MNATISYRFSPAGQRAALAAGLSGAAEQSCEIEVSNGDLVLFDVSPAGALSADARTGGAYREYYADWAKYEFDAPPSPADLITFLRSRATEREEAARARQEAERADKSAQTDAHQAEIERTLTTIRAALASDAPLQAGWIRGGSVGPYQTGCSPVPAAHPDAAEWLARFDREKAARDAAEERRDAITKIGKARLRPTALRADGLYELTVPDSSLSGEWAKLVTGIDPAARGGYAIEGDWLRCNQTAALPAGALIAVGGKSWQGSRKNGGYVHDYALYVVTPAGLRSVGRWTDVETKRGVEYLALGPAERVEKILAASIETCAKRIASLDTLAADPAYAGEAQMIAEYRATWAELQTACERALNGNGGGSITDVDSAAAAIVAAGYRTLAGKYHPDREGGDANTMTLINQARTQLAELLRVAGVRS